MITVELVITPGDDEKVVKTIETIIRVATGLVFDGIDVDINISNWEAATPSEEEEESNDSGDS